MAWLFGSTRRVPSAETDTRAAAREQQVINLQERVPGLQQKSSDSCLYEVEIRAPPDGRKVTLRVFLPTKFPAERPVLQLLSPVSHPWVNNYMQVHGHPAVEGWDGKSPRMIGDVVLEVIREFGREDTSGNSSAWATNVTRPAAIPAANATVPFPGQTNHGHFARGDVPRPTGVGVGGETVASQRSGPGASVTTDVSMPRAARGSRSNQPYKATNHHTQTPGVPTEFEKVKGMTTMQIDRLLEDDVARQALLVGEPSVIGMKEPCTAVWRDNVDTAQSILLKQEEARVLREETEQMRVELDGLQVSYQDKARSKTLGGGEQAIVKQVKHAARTADSNSEQIATNFVEKLLPLQDFMDEFLRERQRYHMLAAKTECMMRDRRS